MKRFGSQFNKQAQSIRLSTAERRELRERLVSYMEYHPMPKRANATPKSVAGVISEPYKVFKINYTYLSSFAGVFAMLTLVAVPVIAEKALPGDVLYPVKVQFNEELRSTLSFSPYAKVEWETTRLERRLAEARLLADEGRLTTEIEAEVAQAVQTHSDAAKHEIATMRESDSDGAALAEIAFASALEVQSEVLESREEQANEVGRSVAALAGVVAQARDGVGTSPEITNPSYEKLVARIEAETVRARELFSSIKPSASIEEINNIERRFDDVKRKVAEADEIYNAFVAQESASSTATSEVATTMATTSEATSSEEITIETEPTVAVDEQDAKTILKVALADTRKLISFMTDIDVRNSVSIDELVPVTLTKDEARVQAQAQLETLQQSLRQINAAEPDDEYLEKFNAGKEHLQEVTDAATIALSQDDYDAVARLAEEGTVITTDLAKMATLTDVDPEAAPDIEPEERASSTEPVESEEEATSTASSSDGVPDTE